MGKENISKNRANWWGLVRLVRLSPYSDNSGMIKRWSSKLHQDVKLTQRKEMDRPDTVVTTQSSLSEMAMVISDDQWNPGPLSHPWPDLGSRLKSDLA